MQTFTKLTKEQGMAAGKEIMADQRCTPEVKAEIRRGLIPTSTGFSYTSSKNGKWFDAVIASFGTDNTCKSLSEYLK